MTKACITVNWRLGVQDYFEEVEIEKAKKEDGMLNTRNGLRTAQLYIPSAECQQSPADHVSREFGQVCRW